MMAKIQAIRRDLWADLAVVGVVLLALLLGMFVRSATLNRTEKFSFDNIGITGRAPAGWVKEFGDDPLMRLRNPFGGAFSPVLELRSRPLADDVDMAMALDALALEHAATVDAYKTLGVDRVPVKKTEATQRRYAYVEIDNNPYVDRLPTVVQGVDLALRHDGRVVIVTFLADADTFDQHYRYFRAFVEGLKFEVVK